jgi:steroid delta-isomerase-like uncharacterized protein
VARAARKSSEIPRDLEQALVRRLSICDARSFGSWQNSRVMTREEVVSLFSRRAAAQGDHDAEALASLYSDACVVESPLGGTHQGRDAIAHVFGTFFDAFPDLELTQEELIIDGDHVVQVGTLSGTDTGGLMGMAPSGRPALVPMVIVCRVADGLIVHERRIYDFTGMLVQIGVLKAKPA